MPVGWERGIIPTQRTEKRGVGSSEEEERNSEGYAEGLPSLVIMGCPFPGKDP